MNDLYNIVTVISDPNVSLTLEFRKKLAEFLLHQEDRISDLTGVAQKAIAAAQHANEVSKNTIKLVNEAADSILKSIPSKVIQ